MKGPAGPWRIIAAIPFALAESLCHEAVVYLIGPPDPWHDALYASVAELDGE